MYNNWSLEHGVVPAVFKSAYITPYDYKGGIYAVSLNFSVRGYKQIGCNSITPRLRCCGAHHNGVSICCQLLSLVLANCRFCQPVRSVRDLGVNIDADLSMRTHVLSTVRACFAALRQIRSVRRSLPRHAWLSLIHALVVSKVDYCNSVLAGVTGNLLYRLQSVLNAAARLVFSARKFNRITPLFRELHW